MRRIAETLKQSGIDVDIVTAKINEFVEASIVVNQTMRSSDDPEYWRVCSIISKLDLFSVQLDYWGPFYDRYLSGKNKSTLDNPVISASERQVIKSQLQEICELAPTNSNDVKALINLLQNEW